MRKLHASRELVRVLRVIHSKHENQIFNVFTRQNFGREKFGDFSTILQFFEGNMLF